MSDELKPISLLYMWLLVTRGGEALLKDIRPDFKPAYRRPLIDRGLVAETPAGRSRRLALTDAGWHYLATHMTDPIQTASAATSANVLQGVLAVLDRHMREKDFNIAEVFSPVPTAEPAAGARPVPESVADDELWSRLRNSWERLQQADEGIPLEKLRPAFSDVPRARLDAALLEWQKQGKIVIYPYDDGERITPAVKDAALHANGRDLHIVYQK